MNGIDVLSQNGIAARLVSNRLFLAFLALVVFLLSMSLDNFGIDYYQPLTKFIFLLFCIFAIANNTMKINKGAVYFLSLILIISLICIANRNNWLVPLNQSIASTLGYIVPFTLFLVPNNKNFPIKRSLSLIRFFPAISLGLAIAAHLAAGFPITRQETSGSIRLAGLNNHAHYAAFLYICVVCSSVYAVSAKKTFAYILLFINLAILLATLTRIYALFGIICTLLCLVQAKNERVKFLAYTAGIMLTPIVLYMLADGLVGEGRLTSTDDSGRSLFWVMIFSNYQIIPLGYGPGFFSSIAEPGTYYGDYFQSPHNEYLRLLFEYGYVGLVSICLLSVYFFAKVIRKLSKNRAKKKREAKILIVFLSSIPVISFFDNTFSSMQFQYMWILAAFLIYRLCTEDKNVALPIRSGSARSLPSQRV